MRSVFSLHKTLPLKMTTWVLNSVLNRSFHQRGGGEAIKLGLMLPSEYRSNTEHFLTTYTTLFFPEEKKNCVYKTNYHSTTGQNRTGGRKYLNSQMLLYGQRNRQSAIAGIHAWVVRFSHKERCLLRPRSRKIAERKERIRNCLLTETTTQRVKDIQKKTECLRACR